MDPHAHRLTIEQRLISTKGSIVVGPDEVVARQSRRRKAGPDLPGVPKPAAPTRTAGSIAEAYGPK